MCNNNNLICLKNVFLNLKTPEFCRKYVDFVENILKSIHILHVEMLHLKTNVGTSFELNPVTEFKQETFPFFLFSTFFEELSQEFESLP